MESAHFDAPALRTFASQCLIECSVDPWRARYCAHVLVDSDACESESHGVYLLPMIVSAIRRGRIKPRGRPKLLEYEGKAPILDGRGCLGPLGARLGIRVATERARSTGLGVAAVRNCSHPVRLGYFLRHSSRSGFVSIAMANTVPQMPVWGSSTPSIGNNVIALAAPTNESFECISDCCTSVVPMLDVELAAKRGHAFAGPIGYDVDGSMSNEPGAVVATRSLRPLGDWKGSGLALLVELLTTAVSGGAPVNARDADGMDALCAFLFIVIAPHDSPSGASRNSELLELLRRASGGDELRFPGQRSEEARARARTRGIRLGAENIQRIEQISKDLNVPLPAPLSFK